MYKNTENYIKSHKYAKYCIKVGTFIGDIYRGNRGHFGGYGVGVYIFICLYKDKNKYIYKYPPTRPVKQTQKNMQKSNIKTQNPKNPKQ